MKQEWEALSTLHRKYSTPNGFNPVESNKSYEVVELIQLYHDKLDNYDSVENQLVPSLAKSHRVSADGKTWTFQLREASAPDSIRLMSEDVVLSVSLCLDERFDCKR